jgi:hypothetical protein
MRLADFEPGRCLLWIKRPTSPGLQRVSARTPLKSIVVASTAINWYGHEGSILRYVLPAFDRAGQARRPAGDAAGLRLPVRDDGAEVGAIEAIRRWSPRAVLRGCQSPSRKGGHQPEIVV